MLRFARRSPLGCQGVRRLCAAARAPAEPAEATADPALPGRRPRDVFVAKKETPYMQLAGAGVAGTAGVGLLVHAHLEWLTPLLPDVAGLSLIAGAVGIASTLKSAGAAAEAAKADGKPGKGEFAMELVPLNDEVRYAAAAAKLRAGADDAAAGTSLGASLGDGEAVLLAAEKAAEQALGVAREEAAAKVVSEVKAQLEAGLAPRRVRQALTPRVFVLDFDASSPKRGGVPGGPPQRPPSTRELLETLREQVSLLLHVASPYDEVVLRVTSPGGSVSDYGLAAAQFARLKAAGVRTTACIDTVAASGGYMIACAAETVLAAPFAIVGSIGVIAGVPNVHKLLEKNGVELVQRTAGEYKRTINIFTPNTDEGIAKFDEELAMVHAAFIAHVAHHRPTIDTPRVCTGETWLALHAEPLHLVDRLSTSDEYLRVRQAEADVFLLRPVTPPRPSGLMALLNRTSASAAALADALPAALGFGRLADGLGLEADAGRAHADPHGWARGIAGGADALGAAYAPPPLLRAASGPLAGEGRA